MRIAICDDEAAFVEIIKNTISQVIAEHSDGGEECEIVTFHSGNNLLEYCERWTLDALFLDISMPDFSGFEVVNLLNEMGRNTVIVFVSSANVMFEAQEFQPFRFVPKDRLAELPRIVKSLLAKIKEMKAKNDRCVLILGRQEIDILFKDTKYFESMSNHKIAMVHQSGKIDYYRGAMNEIDEQLRQFGFLRIQAGYIVNYRFIKTLNSREVTLKDESVIKMGRERSKTAKESFLRFMREDRW